MIVKLTRSTVLLYCAMCLTVGLCALIYPGTKEECTAELKGDSSVTPGGIFAGVGEFFPTRKQKAKPTPPQLRDLDMSYVKEAALRCGYRVQDWEELWGSRKPRDTPPFLY